MTSTTCGSSSCEQTQLAIFANWKRNIISWGLGPDPDLLPVHPPSLRVQEEHRSLQVRPAEQNVVESLETRKPDPGAGLLKQC